MSPAPLNEMITHCDSKGFDVQPVKETAGYRFVIWKGNDIMKIGQKHYKDWHKGQLEVYSKLYQVL